MKTRGEPRSDGVAPTLPQRTLHRPSLRAGGSRGARAFFAAVRGAFAEFLLVPTCLIAGFVVLAVITFLIDRGEPAWLAPARQVLQTYVFADPQAAKDLLGAIAAGVITITSITISLLLIALQQSASALTHQVYDQFLRNWQNQVYFGFFIGVALYALVTLASVGPLNPVFGVTVALAATLLALYLLLVLFYTTVHQMRPVVIIEAIHKHTLAARNVQLGLLRKTRPAPSLDAPVRLSVHAPSHGFVTRIDVAPIAAAADKATEGVEVVLKVHVGDYVAFGQLIGEIKAQSASDAKLFDGVLEEAVWRETKRDIALDPLDGLEELETIGWTSISTAQSDPDAGILTIYSLRDILARWALAPPRATDADAPPVVYVDDVMPRLLNAFESLAVVASESMQHQSYAEILRTFDLVFDDLAPALQQRIEDIVARTLSGFGDHILSKELEQAVDGLIATLSRAGRAATAASLEAAKDRLAETIGKLGGRATRSS
ncbi:MAG TPA: DUF2254 family protein [Casimicrobiaceae bacterium]|nr:DUF2254 family protein [Casimicrobiaceae bacterium]